MKKYIVKSCPCLINDDVVENGCSQKLPHEEDFFCEDRTDCSIKKLINGVKLEYKTPEQLKSYEQHQSDLNYGAICGKHNMAHLVLTSLGVEEVE